MKALQVDLQDELTFTESWMHDSPKNYQVRTAQEMWSRVPSAEHKVSMQNDVAQ